MIAYPATAKGCGFKWSMQHLISNYRDEDVENDQAKGAYSEVCPQDNTHCMERYRRDVHTKLESG